MKKILTTMVIGILFMLTPVLAIGASLTGSVQGYWCVTQGTVCPIGMEDPVAATEQVFVLLVDAKKMDYYFVPNVDRAVMARHLNTEITIDGTVNAKTKSIKANNIIKKGKKVWAVDLEDRIYKDLMGNNPLTSG